MPWKKVDTAHENFGAIDNAVFFGLEEIDYSEYLASRVKSNPKQDDIVIPSAVESKKRERVAHEEDESQILLKPEKKNKAKKAKKVPKSEDITVKVKESPVEVIDSNSAWHSDIQLHTALTISLDILGFVEPTPIQRHAIPLVNELDCDIVGSAETGSGKTLAFCLPVLHVLLHNWAEYGNSHCPFAVMIAPTRELAMQITTVLQEVCKCFRATSRRVEIVNIVGGMSEQKQRRQLSGQRPPHVIVATPGRLCELLSDDSIVAFQDMSLIRFLVIDEVDRMMEEGHFKELYRIFSRIRDHEVLRSKGIHPVEAARKAREGTYEDENEFKLADDVEQQLIGIEDCALMNDNSGEQGVDVIADDIYSFGSEDNAVINGMDGSKSEVLEPVESKRQTLLFSATAIKLKHLKIADIQTGKKGKRDNKDARRKIGELGVDIVNSLPEQLKKLLTLVAVQKRTELVDVSSGSLFRLSSAGKPSHSSSSSAHVQSASEEVLSNIDIMASYYPLLDAL